MKKNTACLLFLGLSIFSFSCQAHSPIPGIGNFYNGLLHPLIDFPHLLAQITFAILLGFQSITIVKRISILFLSIYWLLLITVYFGVDHYSYIALLILTMINCLFILLYFYLPKLQKTQTIPMTKQINYLLMILAIFLAIVIALSSAPEGLNGGAKLTFLLASAITSSFLMLTPAIAVNDFVPRYPWLRIVFSILISWILTVTLLSLAFIYLT